MHFIWLAVAVGFGIAFTYLEWIANAYSARAILRQEDGLPRKKRDYVLVAGAMGFLAVTALYFALVAYWDASIGSTPGCWLSASLLAGVMASMRIHVTLRRNHFRGDD